MGSIDAYNKGKALGAQLQFPPNMDYTYYAAANQQQPYQFLGLPPTPSHNEFSNGSPPVSIMFSISEA
jgi:hypothetical protein